MSTAKNDITGDLIASKISSNNYRDNYDAIFRKNKETEVKDEESINDDVASEQHNNPS